MDLQAQVNMESAVHSVAFEGSQHVQPVRQQGGSRSQTGGPARDEGWCVPLADIILWKLTEGAESEKKAWLRKWGSGLSQEDEMGGEGRGRELMLFECLLPAGTLYLVVKLSQQPLEVGFIIHMLKIRKLRLSEVSRAKLRKVISDEVRSPGCHSISQVHI